jgi:dCMP deaminase
MHTQEEWDRLFLNIALNVANMSTCAKYKVGAVLVADRRIVSTGYNGTPAGCIHCTDIYTEELLKDPDKRLEHREWSRRYELHAEVNAIIDAGKRGVLRPKDSLQLYVTRCPCIDCAKLIVATGIIRVISCNDITSIDSNTFNYDAHKLFDETCIKQDVYSTEQVNGVITLC